MWCANIAELYQHAVPYNFICDIICHEIRDTPFRNTRSNTFEVHEKNVMDK